MMYELIQRHAADAAAAGDWDAVAATLNAASITQRNEQAWTYSDLVGLLGMDSARIVAGTVKAAAGSDPLMGPVDQALATVGVRLDADDRQAMIDALAAAGSWPVELTAAVKAAGVQQVSPATQAGLGTVSAEDCRAAWNTVTLQQQWAEIQNDTINAAVAVGDRAALATALRDAADAVGAG